jgi:phosphatidate cytidylyltransferase
MIFNKMSHLNQRIIVSGLAICIVLLSVYLSSFAYFRPLFLLTVSAIIGGAVWEYYQMSKSKGCRPLDIFGIVSTVAYVVAVFLSTQNSEVRMLPEATLAIVFALSFAYYFAKGSSPILNLAVTFFGILYLAVPLACFVNINYFFLPDATQDGRWWLVFLLLVVKMTDIGAFFVGKTFGRTLLAPSISPKKTWEGAVGGLITGLFSGLIFYLVTSYAFASSPLDITFRSAFWLSLCMSLIAQFGDLAESVLKRDAAIKDSNQLPGLGGILDIVDSLVFTTPFVYIFLKIKYP